MSRRARVELWTAAPEPGDLERAAELLDAAERARLARFRSERAALEYAAGHGLLRRVLASLAPIDPPDWRFVVGPHGRPDLDPGQPGLPAGLWGLSFNLSHTRGLVAVAVSLDGDVGVDVEHRSRANDLRRLAEAKFAQAECDWLADAPDEECWRRRFFRVWTLKEAYLKARGVGISVPLAEFAVRADDGREPTIAFAAGFDGPPAAWSFARRDQGPEHELAVALRRAALGGPLELVEREGP